MTTKRKNYATDNDAWERLKAGATMAQHTPGPWTVEGIRLQDDGAETIMVRANEDTTTVGYVFEGADARLIAAAPEMLAVLRDCAEALKYAAQVLQAPENSAFRETLADARALLARVEGKDND